MGSANDSVAGGAKGKDAKGKDAKAAKPAKGGATDEKNAPKAIEIEYPEIESEPDFLILEHSFMQQKSDNKANQNKKKKESGAATPATTSATGDKAGAAATTQATLESKKAAKLAELSAVYETVRALEPSCAIVLKLNYEPPKEASADASEVQSSLDKSDPKSSKNTKKKK